ncbi:hypothetical protein BKA70DRAFT_676510 [Coprinopsis sp. MPI-PUGE-AT-0042]|nr:hypothetical protein BKA70DRAFT_676510 [Coprinopsis sp. MPI-PUGE-AT-0042]
MDGSKPLDPAQLARATKKVVDRLAPFCSLRLDAASSTAKSNTASPAVSPFVSPAASRSPSMSNGLHAPAPTSSIGHGDGGQNPSSSPPIADASRVVLKIQTKVQALISAIDAHVQSCQIALKVAQDSESNSSDRLSRARKGLELSKGTEAVFIKVSQDIYKIASHTRDRSEVVVVPPGAGQEPSLHLTLSKVGLDLVANLGLFLQYATMVEQTVSYWMLTVKELEEAEPSPDVPVTSNAGEEGWQAYSDIISPLRDEYHELFPLSTDTSPDADCSIEEMLLSGDYEYLETDEGYIIVSRRIPLPTSADPTFFSRRTRAIRLLLSGKESRSSSSGMRGLLMWDCSRKRSSSTADGSGQRRISRRLSFRTIVKRRAEDDDNQEA